jgi:hypothetical protein
MYFDTPSVDLKDEQHKGVVDAVSGGEKHTLVTAVLIAPNLRRVGEESMDAAHRVVHAQVVRVRYGSVFDVYMAEEDEAVTIREGFVVFAKEGHRSFA